MTRPPFFIVGYERSGTTLIAAALDRHTRIAIPPETHFFTDVCPPLHARHAADRDFLLDHFFRGFRTRDLNLNPDELRARLNHVEPTWINLFLEALKLYAEPRGKELVGEKTPKHWRCLPDILNLFPESKAIWIVRDGRDTVCSIMKMPWKPHNNLALHAMQWRYAMDRLFAFESQFPTRILRMKFEDLLASPESEIGRACNFIGVDFEPQQLDPSAQTGVVPSWEMPWKERVFAPLDLSRIGSARRDLPPASYQLLTLLMQPTLLQLGYELSANSCDMKQAV